MPTQAWSARFPDNRTALPLPPTFTKVVFSTVGTTSWTPPAGVTSVAVLVVGGGGRGNVGLTSTVSNVSGGGGGAGGVLYQAAFAVTPGTPVTVTVGDGGSASSPDGQQSVFGSLVAYGGDNTGVSANVGSGFGGMWETGTGGAGHLLPTSGTPGQGNAGGDTYTGGTTAQASTSSGGGGGAGTVGGTAISANRGGGGGAGSTITLPEGSVYVVGGGGGGGAGGLGIVGAGGTGGGGAGGTQRTTQTTFGADLFAASLSVTLTTGSTTSMVVGDYIIGSGSGGSGFAAGTRVASIVNSTTFTIDQFPPVDFPGSAFGVFVPPIAGAANTGGGGGGAGRTNTNCGYALPGANGGSGLVVLVY